MTRRAPSILARIVLLHLGALLVISVAITAAAYLLLNSIVNNLEERVLEDHAGKISTALKFADGRWTLSLSESQAAAYGRHSGGYALAVKTGEGRVLYSSFPSSPQSPGHFDQSPGFSHRRVGKQTFYGLTVPVRQDGHTAWIEVGQNLASPDVIVDDVVARFISHIAWLVVPIFALLFFADILLLRRLLRPIVDASRVAAAIGPDNERARLPVLGLPREVLPLANAVNQALARLEQALRAQREFTADAAHELRTPLAILRMQVDTSMEGETAHRLRSDIDAMSHIVDQLLVLAELENAVTETSGNVDLVALASEAVGLMAPLALAENKSVELQVGTSPGRIRGHYHLLLRALCNLIENALRHTPQNTAVTVLVNAPATLEVRDHGPGIPSSERTLVFRRFWRRDRGQTGHAGLGLAIVSKIVQLHGGTVDIFDNAGGGAVFRIALAEIGGPGLIPPGHRR